jgi:integrase/recombinase XerC
MKKTSNYTRRRQTHATGLRHTSAASLRHDLFPTLLRSFFQDWLAEQRNASVHTIRSYRDTWRLFLRFVAARKRKAVAEIKLVDLTASEVSAFLGHAEHDRKGTIGTRNCRLAAIRSFFHFAAGKEPTAIAQCTEVIAVHDQARTDPGALLS